MSQPADVVVDMAALYLPGHDRGLGRYARALQSLLPELSEFNIVEYPGRTSSGGSRLSEWTAIPHRVRFVSRHGGHFHATSPYNVDPVHVRKSGVTVQDLIPLDLQSYTKSGLKARMMFRWTKAAAAFVVPSSHTAERLEAFVGASISNLVIAPLPPRFDPQTTEATDCHDVLPERLDTRSPYVVAEIDVRAPNARKRVPWIFGAAAHLARYDIPLVAFGGGTEALQVENVIGLGRVCDAHMNQLLRDASAFVYASAYEGQGLPPQEALLAGTPVVAFRNTSLPEMVGPGAIWLDEIGQPWRDYVDASPLDRQASELGEAAAHLVQSPTEAQRIAEEGAAHVGQFTPEAFRLAITDFYGRFAGL